MQLIRHRVTIIFLFFLLLIIPQKNFADNPDTFLLTVILRHDQSKTLDQINEHLENTGFWDEFPPEGVKIVSWYVMMGIGHVVTLEVPPSKLRAVNLAIEKNAWGAYQSAFHPTYDFVPIWQNKIKNKSN